MGKEKINLLDTVPCRSSHVTTAMEGEEVILSFPRFRRAWMNRWLLPKGMSKDIYIRLEEHGSAVWTLIDGQRTVGEIIALLTGHFNNEAGYGARVSVYLMQMQRDGLIKLRMKN